MLINSSKLAAFDLDILIGKVGNANRIPLTRRQVEYQVYSLEQNVQIIRDIQVTRLPKAKAMNYQAYRQDLSDIIFRIKAEADEMSGSHEGKESFLLSESDQKNFFQALAITRFVVHTDRIRLAHGKKLGGEYLEFNQRF